MISNYEVTLKHIASSVGISPALLEHYLYGTLNSYNERAFLQSKAQQIEQYLAEDGFGVFYCLLHKTNHISFRPSTVNEFIVKLLQGVFEECVESRYQLQYHVSHRDLATEDYFRHVLTQNPDAAILLMIPERAETLADVCTEMKRPCLIMDYQNEADKPIYTLNVENHRPVFTLTQKLIELGHKRIAFITGPMGVASARQRHEGYVDALEAAQIPYDETIVKYGNWQVDTAKGLTKELLALRDRPTAIVCSNDHSALGAYSAIMPTGLSIPKDISIVGFDDIRFVSNLTPPLTTVNQPLTLMGRKAASTLIKAMEGNPSGEFRIEYPLEIVWRESIGVASEQVFPVDFDANSYEECVV